MTTVHPRVAINHDEIQRQLYSVEIQVWNAQHDLGVIARTSVYLTPPPAFTEALAALEMAHDFIGRIRQALRDAEKGSQ